jgi:hypothetical protein
MKVRFYAFAALVAILPLSGFTLSKLDGFSVKRQVKEGQTQKMLIKGQFDISGQSAEFSGQADEKVTKVATDDGAYTIEERQHDLKAVVGGQDIPINDTPTVTTVFNADGSIRQIVGDSNVDASAYRLADLGVIWDSGKTLNIGDTWTYAIKADTKTGAEAATATYKLVGQEKVGDIDTYKVQATVKESSGSEPAASDGFYWLDKSDASLVKAELTWSNAPFPGAPAPISGKLTITRQGN